MTPARIRRRKKQRAGLAVSFVLILFCTALLGIGVWLFLQESGGADSVARPFQTAGLDPAAKTGAIGSPVRERSLGESKFGYRIETSPTFSAAGKGDINIENPVSNQYLLVLELCRKGDPALLYQSQYIAPNQYIDSITLSKVPGAGVHDCVAYLNLVDPATMDVVDILECPIKMAIVSK